MGRSRWAHETMCVQPSIWTHIAVTRSVPATDYWNRLYGSGKGPIWVQSLVAKWISSFQSDYYGTVTRRAIQRTWLTASNTKENHIGLEQRWWHAWLAWTLIQIGGCTIWTAWHYGARVESYSISKKKQGYIDYIILHRYHRCIAW